MAWAMASPGPAIWSWPLGLRKPSKPRLARGVQLSQASEGKRSEALVRKASFATIVYPQWIYKTRALTWRYNGHTMDPVAPRRRRPESHLKLESLRLRLSAREKALWTAAATKAERTLSDWLRYVANRAAKARSV